MSANGRNYLANHVVAPQIIQGTPNYNVEVADGQVPPGEFFPAQYLPAILSENRIAGSAYVLMPGKVVCLDDNKRLVPAGLVAEVKKARSVSGYNFSGSATTYGALSEQNGVVTSTGVYAAAGDGFVAANNFSTSASGFDFTMPVGIMRYSALKSPGSDPSNPATFTQHAYDTGGARAFSRYCYIQVPVVETQQRTEVIPAGSQNYRILLYADASGVTISGLTKVANQIFFSNPASGGVATQFCLIGRTIMFNGVTSGALNAVYTPQINTPFACVSVSSAVATAADLMGAVVSYDVNSNYVIVNPASMGSATAPHIVGQILDVKVGQNDDLKLVRSYFRDFGLWQEQPGSATDGRNTQLSIANAPKYIARIAVDFASLFQAYLR
jgi:hypothetical protein